MGIRAKIHLAVLLGASGLVPACFKGAGFFRQSGAEQAPAVPEVATVVLPTTESAGGSTAAVKANANASQVVGASNNSFIAGASVTFPPGAIAIDTDITVQPGENIANVKVADQLAIGTQIAASGQPVAVTSGVAMDTPEPFTIALPLPDGSALALTDPYANLAVLYHVKKVSAGNADFTGIIGKGAVLVVNGYVKVTTSFFGTYQAIITQAKVSVAREVAALPAAVSAPKVPAKFAGTLPRVHFVRGAAAASFGDFQGQTASGLQGWVQSMTPARVGAGPFMSTGTASAAKVGE